MARQSATRHLAILEDANRITTMRRGREKLHYLNPVTLHEIQERWIAKFQKPRLRALSTLKRQAEEDMTDVVRLTVTNENLDAAQRDELGAGWAAVLSNLKSFLETGALRRG